jgi:hypothetical protein
MFEITIGSPSLPNNAIIRTDLWSIGKESIAMFKLATWLASFPDFFILLICYTVSGKQLLFSNDRNRFRLVVLGLSQDGASTDLFENLSVNSLKGDLSNAITFKPPLFSVVNTFKLNSSVPLTLALLNLLKGKV